MFNKVFSELEETKEKQERKELTFELVYKIGGLSFLLFSMMIPVLLRYFGII